MINSNLNQYISFYLLILSFIAPSALLAQDVEHMNKKELRAFLNQSYRREDSLKSIVLQLSQDLAQLKENQSRLQLQLQDATRLSQQCQQEKDQLIHHVSALNGENQAFRNAQLQLKDSIDLLTQEIQQLMENIREVEPDNVYPASIQELFSPIEWTERYCEWAQAQKAEINEYTNEWDTTCKTYQIQLLKWNEPGLLADSIERIMLDWVNDDIQSYEDVDRWLKSLHDPEYAAETTTSAQIIHINDHYVNFSISSEWYGGGAHPDFDEMSYLLDKQTGVRIKRENLFLPNKMGEFKKMSGETFFKQWQQEGNDISELEINRASFYLPENYSLSAEGITFSFARYEIGPYVIGYPSFTIPIEACKRYLQPSIVQFMESIIGDD